MKNTVITKPKKTNLEKLIDLQTIFYKRSFVDSCEYGGGAFALFRCKEKMGYIMVWRMNGSCVVSTQRVQASYLDTLSMRRSPEKDKYATSRFYEAVDKICYGN